MIPTPKVVSPAKYRPLMVRLPPPLDKRLRIYANNHERPLSWCIRKALEEWLKGRNA